MKSEVIKPLVLCAVIVTFSLTYLYFVHKENMNNPEEDMILKVSLTPWTIITDTLDCDNEELLVEPEFDNSDDLRRFHEEYDQIIKDIDEIFSYPNLSIKDDES